MSLLASSEHNRRAGHLGARMLVACALLAGCGGSSSDVENTSSNAAAATTAANAAASPDTSASSSGDAAGTGACRLITSAEAEAALGVSIQPTSNKDLGVENGLQHDTCAYASTDFQGVITVQLFTGAGAVDDFAQQKLTYANTAKSVSGIGEEAFQLSGDVVGPGAGDLRFRVGSNEVQIEIHSDAPDLDAKLLELGRAAAGRL